MKVVNALDCGNGRGDCWRDNDNNNVGVDIGIVIGPDSSGVEGDFALSLCPRVEDHVARRWQRWQLRVVPSPKRLRITKLSHVSQQQ